MGSSEIIQLIVLVCLLTMSAFFSSAETSFMSCNKMRIHSLAEEGDKRAITLEVVLSNQSKLLSAILIGNNIVNLSASSMATVLATKLWGSSGAGIATGILTVLILIFGEISPKTLATVHADSIALKYAGIVHVFMVVCTPVVFVVNKLSRGVLRLIGVDPDARQSSITESELRSIVNVSHEEGVIESEEKKMINNVVDFGDSLARDVMVPRIDMVFAQVDMTYEELLHIFEEERFTRLPVYEDSTDNVIGIINMKDLLLYRQDEPFDIHNYLREGYFTHEYKKTSELFRELRAKNITLAIVLDEYGATAGLITLEDLLEEIVGEIRDEFDQDEEEDVQEVANNEYIIEGSMKLSDVNDELDLALESEHYDSIGGFIFGLLDHLPQSGESVTYENLILEVASVEKKRIEKVRLTILPKVNEIENKEEKDAKKEISSEK